jgi:uncharacterized membrane protein
MAWVQRHQLRHYVADSIWILPLTGCAAAIVFARTLRVVESEADWSSWIDAETVRWVLGTMASSMLTFTVFVCSALLVAVQLASVQLTPRIISVVFRDPVTKRSLTVFVFSFTFTLVALVGIGSSVPPLTVHVAAYSCIASLAVFLYLIDHIGKFLRPSGALRVVARMGRDVILSVYPDGRLSDAHATSDGAGARLGEPTSTVPSPSDGVVIAVHMQGLSELAQRAGCVIEIVPQVGDFVAAGDPLFRTYQGAGGLPDRALTDCIALGPERTIRQDPLFVFRIVVDIANKALSRAINDPTTAVLAIDHIHHLLRTVGSRSLKDGVIRDAAGHVRLMYRTPDWDDFVYLAVTEIRQFGADSIQVVRRLRAMLENLIETLPERRRPLLRHELELLQRTTMRFAEPEDRALAEISDVQGVGGHRGTSQAPPPSAMARQIA